LTLSADIQGPWPCKKRVLRYVGLVRPSYARKWVTGFEKAAYRCG